MKPKTRFTGFQQLWICTYALLGWLSLHFQIPPASTEPILWASLKAIFLRALDAVFFIHSLKSRDESDAKV